MRLKMIYLSVLLLLLIIGGWYLLSLKQEHSYVPSETPRIYLYGEVHGDEEQIKRAIDAFKEHYDEGVRFLFVEAEYYRAEVLNMWMESDDDELLVRSGVAPEFYRAIKSCCEEAIFVGTDIGHDIELGQWFLNNVDSNSKEHEYARQSVEQAEIFYSDENDEVREKFMVKNFIQFYDELDGDTIVGIYGDFHANPNADTKVGDSYIMVKQLKEYYGDVIQYEYLGR